MIQMLQFFVTFQLWKSGFDEMVDFCGLMIM